MQNRFSLGETGCNASLWGFYPMTIKIKIINYGNFLSAVDDLTAISLCVSWKNQIAIVPVIPRRIDKAFINQGAS